MLDVVIKKLQIVFIVNKSTYSDKLKKKFNRKNYKKYILQ